MGLSIKKQSISPLTIDGYQFPIEPMVSIRGRNVIAENLIAKNKDAGTVAEFWQTDSYEIEIKGRLIGEDVGNQVDDDIQKIANKCTLHKKLEVNCPFLTFFGIQYIVVKDFDFPFTAGENNQEYTIKAISIKPFDLF